MDGFTVTRVNINGTWITGEVMLLMLCVWILIVLLALLYALQKDPKRFLRPKRENRLLSTVEEREVLPPGDSVRQKRMDAWRGVPMRQRAVFRESPGTPARHAL